MTRLPIPANMPIMATTIISSTKVKPFDFLMHMLSPVGKKQKHKPCHLDIKISISVFTCFLKYKGEVFFSSVGKTIKKLYRNINKYSIALPGMGRLLQKVGLPAVRQGIPGVEIDEVAKSKKHVLLTNPQLALIRQVTDRDFRHQNVRLLQVRTASLRRQIPFACILSITRRHALAAQTSNKMLFSDLQAQPDSSGIAVQT